MSLVWWGLPQPLSSSAMAAATLAAAGALAQAVMLFSVFNAVAVCFLAKDLISVGVLAI
jgi:hypothetical protein